MSEIAREALLGMGFRVNDYVGDGVFALNVNDRYLCLHPESGDIWLSDDSGLLFGLEVFPETLPQLRQLIRSLFGDDALPRRELSSITEGEFILALQEGVDCAGIPNFYLESLGGYKNRGSHIVCKIKDSDDFVYDYTMFFNKELSKFNVVYFEIKDGTTDTENPMHLPIEMGTVSYLIKELDIYLPAFHDDKGGEQ